VTIRLSWAFTALTIAGQILWVLVSGTTRDTFTVGGVVLFFLASLTHSLATQPPGWTARFFAISLLFGWAIEAIGTGTGLPFGAYTYGDRLGADIGSVPWVIPLAWAMMAYPIYVVAARISMGAFTRVLLAATLLATWDLFLDPQMVSERHWWFADPTPALPGVAGIPLSNFVGWIVAALIVMTIVELLAGPPAEPLPTTSPPVVLLTWVYLSNVLANAVFFGRPAVALIGGIAMGIPMAIVWAGLRRPEVREFAR